MLLVFSTEPLTLEVSWIVLYNVVTSLVISVYLFFHHEVLAFMQTLFVASHFLWKSSCLVWTHCEVLFVFDYWRAKVVVGWSVKLTLLYWNMHIWVVVTPARSWKNFHVLVDFFVWEDVWRIVIICLSCWKDVRLFSEGTHILKNRVIFWLLSFVYHQKVIFSRNLCKLSIIRSVSLVEYLLIISYWASLLVHLGVEAWRGAIKRVNVLLCFSVNILLKESICWNFLERAFFHINSFSWGIRHRVKRIKEVIFSYFWSGVGEWHFVSTSFRPAL